MHPTRPTRSFDWKPDRYATDLHGRAASCLTAPHIQQLLHAERETHVEYIRRRALGFTANPSGGDAED